MQLLNFFRPRKLFGSFALLALSSFVVANVTSAMDGGAASPKSPIGTSSSHALAHSPVQPQGGEKDVVHFAPWVQGDMEAAFAEAKRDQKPMLLYWGAVWCPPCNELKSQVFSHPRFNELVKPLIAIYLDGDQQNAQTWGEKLKIKGYPTVLLLGPQGDEWMRLTASTDFNEFELSLSSALAAAGSATQALARAESGKGTESDWRVLAYNRWYEATSLDLTPEATIGKHTALIRAIPKNLKVERALIAASALSSVGAAASTLDDSPKDKVEDSKVVALRAALAGVREDALAWLDIVLADAETMRASAGFFVEESSDVVAWLEPHPNEARQRLEARVLAAAAELRNDTTLSVGTRLGLLVPKIKFAIEAAASKGGQAKLPPALIAEIQAAVVQADKDAVSAYDRHAVIDSAADLLAQVGDLPGARLMLTRELKKTNTPWYYESSLASLEKSANRKEQALKWSSAARLSAKGRASRIQWIVSDIMMMSQLLKPGDTGASTRLAQVVGEYYDVALGEVDGFTGRNNGRANRVVKILKPWMAQPKIKATVLSAANRCNKLAQGDVTCGEHFKALQAM
jgi:protein disulfide-isomerase